MFAMAAVLQAGEMNAMWPAEKTGEREILGRKIIRFDHDCLKIWGAETGREYFNVLLPTKKSAQPHPLLVFLHSAGGNADGSYDEVLAACNLLNMGGPEFVGLMPDSPSNGAGGWWGFNDMKADPAKYDRLNTPVEQRVLATIEWVVRKYNVDRNRIYLAGASMGGSGTLGIGMCHGDIFAAIWACCPAGSEHVMRRMRLALPPKADAAPDVQKKYLNAVSGAGLPDAPPILSFASPSDSWSSDLPQFLRAAHDGRHALVFAWGPWNHGYMAYLANPAAYQFPWLKIRRNEAYPVFTDATSDREYPGSNPKSPDTEGQLNAFFRWKNVKDSPEEFAIELSLVGAADLNKEAPKPLREVMTPQPPPPPDLFALLPERSTADVTLRRLQKFALKTGFTYEWSFGQGNDAVSGTLKPDSAGLLTFKRLIIKNQPSRLTVKRKT